MKWGIVGTGKISRSVVADLGSVRADVVLVHSRVMKNAERFAEEFGVGRFTDSYEEVLASKVDIIYIATPFATHYELTRQAILAGKHVLVEKPMATCAEEVEELFRLAEMHNVFLMEGMWMKFNPAFRLLLREVVAGRIGEPRSLRSSFCMPMPEEGSRWNLHGSPGALLDQGIYPVTLAHCLFGAPNSVYAVGRLRGDGLDLAEHFTLEFDAGRFATGSSSMIDLGEASAAVSGTTGWIVLPAMFWATTSLEIHAGTWERIMHNPERVDIEREGYGYVPMLREVAKALDAGWREHPVHTAEHTLAVFRTLDEIRRQLVAADGQQR